MKGVDRNHLERFHGVNMVGIGLLAGYLGRLCRFFLSCDKGSGFPDGDSAAPTLFASMQRLHAASTTSSSSLEGKA